MFGKTILNILKFLEYNFKDRTNVTFAITGLQTEFHTRFTIMFIFCKHTKCHAPSLSLLHYLLLSNTKPRKIFARSPYCHFIFTKKIILTSVKYFSKNCYIISVSYIKLCYRRFHHRSSHIRHAIITNSRRLKSTTLYKVEPGPDGMLFRVS